MSQFDSAIDDFFSAQGPLSQHYSKYSPREAQITMAKAVAKALEQERDLVCEAGTGTGKTYAYLLPAILSASEHNQRIVLSTATKNLQDQLFLRDIPNILELLNLGLSLALLKGRRNYLCLYRVFDSRFNDYQDKELLAFISYLQGMHQQTQFGEIAEFSQIEENHQWWNLFTCPKESCYRSQCEYFAECYVYKARQRAQSADLLVLNHHLYVLELQGNKTQSLLSDCDLLILDEAHQVPDIARDFYATSLSAKQLKLWLKDMLKANLAEAGEQEKLTLLAKMTAQQLDELNLALGQTQAKLAWCELKKAYDFQFKELARSVRKLEQLLETLATIGPGLHNSFKRAQGLSQALKELIEEPDNQEYCYQWHINRSQSSGDFMIRKSPLDIAQDYIHDLRQLSFTTVYTSATLSSGNGKLAKQQMNQFEDEGQQNEGQQNEEQGQKGSNVGFEFFTQQLGLESSSSCENQTQARLKKIDLLQLASPFNYQEQCLLYAPFNLPEPQHDSYIKALIDACLPVFSQLEGRSLLLFTSYQSLNQAYDYLASEQFKDKHFNLLAQGQAAKNHLIKSFIETPNSLLLATSSFWQGIDIPGDALSCVVIAKLPFASPYDPLIAAKIDYLRRQGKEPFYDYQIPQAIIHFKQGIGRLIRSLSDFGVLIVGDKRLYSKSYGRMFRAILPPMEKTQELSQVERFLQQFKF